MHQNGLSKLTEECGELLQVTGKLMAYPEGTHPDGKGDLYLRLEEEMADALAAIEFSTQKLGLSEVRINYRKMSKIMLFEQWGRENG